MTGRPTIFTQELADKICDLISTSSDGLRKICEENDVTYTTVKRWLQTNKEFCAQYELAKQEQSDILADEILELVDNKQGDLIEGEFGLVGNSTNVARVRLQVDARKWVASKLKPKRYGDKIQNEITGDLKLTQITGMEVK